MLDQKQFKLMYAVSGKMTAPLYNTLLRKVCPPDSIEKYVCLPQPGAGLRIRLVPPVIFDSMSKVPPAQLFDANGVRVLVTGLSESGPPCSGSSHPVVSTWLIDHVGLHKEEISYRFTELLAIVYGPGFGERECNAQMGANIYLGNRASDQSTPSPVEGPGRATLSHYFRDYYQSPYLRATIEKKSKGFLRKVLVFSSQVNYMMGRFLPVKTPCALWTKGIADQVYGFTNDKHVDRYDRLGRTEQERILVEARRTCAAISNSKYTPSVLAYLEECARTIGFGYSTTCGYQHVFHPSAPQDKITVLQFFCNAGTRINLSD